jgi:hypothetical protein
MASGCASRRESEVLDLHIDDDLDLKYSLTGPDWLYALQVVENGVPAISLHSADMLAGERLNGFVYIGLRGSCRTVQLVTSSCGTGVCTYYLRTLKRSEDSDVWTASQPECFYDRRQSSEDGILRVLTDRALRFDEDECAFEPRP